MRKLYNIHEIHLLIHFLLNTKIWISCFKFIWNTTYWQYKFTRLNALKVVLTGRRPRLTIPHSQVLYTCANFKTNQSSIENKTRHLDLLISKELLTSSKTQNSSRLFSYKFSQIVIFFSHISSLCKNISPHYLEETENDQLLMIHYLYGTTDIEAD